MKRPRDAIGRFVAYARPQMEGGTEALTEFQAAVSGITDSLLQMKQTTDTLVESSTKETKEDRKSFVTSRARLAVLGLFVAGLTKATRALDAWTKASVASMRNMEKSSKLFASMLGAKTVQEALGDAKARESEATKRWEEAGGRSFQKPENMPWWARSHQVMTDAAHRTFRMPTQGENVESAKLEMQAASRQRRFLENQLGKGGRMSFSMTGFAEAGAAIQKQIIDREMQDMTQKIKDTLIQIEANTRGGGVAR